MELEEAKCFVRLDQAMALNSICRIWPAKTFPKTIFLLFALSVKTILSLVLLRT